MATLYYLLTQTNKKVILIEKDQVASGATGNNAGMVAAHIEKPIAELIDEFGLEKTRQTYYEIDRSWDLLQNILNNIDQKDNFIPVSQAALGLATVENLLYALKQEELHDSIGRSKWTYTVIDDESIKQQIPPEYLHNITFVSKESILSALRLQTGKYVAAAIPGSRFRSGRINGAKFCCKIISWLQQKLPERFAVHENTEIKQVEVSADFVVLHHEHGQVKVADVILCTNAYKDFHIVDQASQQRITKLNDAITVREGYLSAYIDAKSNSEIYAVGFFDNDGTYENVPYFYMSYGPVPTQLDTNMVLIGGPEYDLPWPCPETLIKDHTMASYAVNIEFIKHSINSTINSVDYFWRGIMGYTNNGLRWVGQDPAYAHLWYNLGCNGIGILQALAGGEKIADLMQGKTFPPSLFDPT